MCAAQTLRLQNQIIHYTWALHDWPLLPPGCAGCHGGMSGHWTQGSFWPCSHYDAKNLCLHRSWSTSWCGSNQQAWIHVAKIHHLQILVIAKPWCGMSGEASQLAFAVGSEFTDLVTWEMLAGICSQWHKEAGCKLTTRFYCENARTLFTNKLSSPMCMQHTNGVYAQTCFAFWRSFPKHTLLKRFNKVIDVI